MYRIKIESPCTEPANKNKKQRESEKNTEKPLFVLVSSCCSDVSKRRSEGGQHTASSQEVKASNYEQEETSTDDR